MKTWVWIRGWWDDLRDSLWLVPAVVVAVSAGAASLLSRFDAAGLPDTLVFGGTPDGARAVLSVLAGATITVTGLVFSLTVVALQMASSQFTPRLLRTFLRDRATQIVLSGMLGSSVFHVAVLRTVRSDGDGAEAFVPRLAVSLSLLYSLFAVGLLVFFLHHVTQHMRVDVVMRKIAKEAVARVSAVDDVELPDREPIDPPSDADVVVARRGGYLQRVEVQQLTSHEVRLSLLDVWLGKLPARVRSCCWGVVDGRRCGRRVPCACLRVGPCGSGVLVPRVRRRGSRSRCRREADSLGVARFGSVRSRLCRGSGTVREL